MLSVALSGVSGGYDNKVKVWALTGEASAECVATLTGHTKNVWGVVAGPDFVVRARPMGAASSSCGGRWRRQTTVERCP